VLSRNAVGYIKINAESNKLYLVSNPFVSMGTNDDVVTNMFASLPNSVSVSLWNESSQAYETFTKSARGAWSANATTRIDRADAVFIRMPANAGADMYFMGEVPDSTTAPSTIQSRVTGITMLGFPYPVAQPFTNTSMAIDAPNGSSVSVWDADAGSYISYTKSARGAWDAAAQAATIAPGQGFVIRSTASGSDITTDKPYDWP